MGEPIYEAASVDLTEDEDSCGEDPSIAATGFHFVDCTSEGMLSHGITPIQKPVANVVPPPPLTPIRKFVTQQQSNKPTIRLKPLPKMIRKPETAVNSPPMSSQVRPLNQEVDKSVYNINRACGEIKPAVSRVVESQGAAPISAPNNFEIICVDSDGESSSKEVAPVPTAPTVVPAKHPPGKMLVIKKNNKYFKIIIPHNVIPDINQSTGPVLINIPEVGPLVITSDHRGNNPLQMQNTRLSLNLDAIAKQAAAAPGRVAAPAKAAAPPLKQDEPVEVEPNPENSEKLAQLYSNKYCWRYLKGRKRDLDGFTYYDRFGFNKAETARARKCAKYLELIVAKKRGELVNELCKYQKFKNKDEVKVKLVEISDIVNMNKGGKDGRRRSKNGASNDPLQITKPRRRIVRPVRRAEYREYDSDLLLTKKVVILNNKNREVDDYGEGTPGPSKPKQLRKAPFLKQMNLMRAKRTAKCKDFIPKPCYVQMTRDERVEDAYRDYCSRMGYDYTQKLMRKMNKQKMKVRGSGTTPKPFTTDKVNATKLNSKTFYGNIVKIFCTRIIDSEERFIKELNNLKPLLLVNENNISTLNYSSEFSKSNILYVVKERNFPKNVLLNEGFISGVELGYIKLVDSQLFCKYIMEPAAFKLPQTEPCTSEHNYCFVKNK